MSILEDLQSAVSTVAERAGTGIVGIGRGNRGSGIVIAEGKVLTNAHNLRGDEVTVTFADGRRTRGPCPGRWRRRPRRRGRRYRRCDRPRVGRRRVPGPRLGGLRGRRQPRRGTRVTFGLVSATARSFRGPGGRRISGSIEHTAPLAPGSSGGALLDATGTVVGVNTNRIGEGFYLALPADAALRERIDALGRGESPDPDAARRRGRAGPRRPTDASRRRTPGACRCAGPWCRGWQPRRRSRHRWRRPDRVGRRQGHRRRRRPLRGPGHRSRSRSSSCSCAGPRSGPSRSASIGAWSASSSGTGWVRHTER